MDDTVNSQKSHNSPKQTSNRHRLIYPIALLCLMVSLFSNSNVNPLKQIYENSKYNISLEKPFNWDLYYSERNNTIYLSAKIGIADKDSVYVQIWGASCSQNLEDPYEELENNIERIRRLYSLATVTTIQNPNQIDIGGYKVTKALISIPKSVMQDESDRNQNENQGNKLFQTIEISVIRDKDNHSTIAYIYQGYSDLLNSQAKEIIESIYITCETSP